MSATRKDDEKDEIKESLLILSESKTLSDQKEFAKEELAIQWTVKRITDLLKDSRGDFSQLIKLFPVDDIEDMTRHGHLALVAKQLNNNFLPAIEEIVKNSSVVFTSPNKESIKLSALYSKCYHQLAAKNKTEKPSFSDILLRMYTYDSSFYKKINAIVGGYNDPKETTEEEKVLALLMNLAIYKASLDKSDRELHEFPIVLFRGQRDGLDEMKKKFQMAEKSIKINELLSCTPEQLSKLLSQLDIGKTLTAKKILSLTTVEKVAEIFVSDKHETGVIAHIENLSILDSLCDVAEVSTSKGEKEYVTRVPDDVLLIPTKMYQDKTNQIYHVNVFCMRSADLALENSTRYARLRDEAVDLVKAQVDKHRTNERHIELFNELYELLKNAKIDSSPAEQTAFVNNCLKIMIELYRNYEPERRSKILDPINDQVKHFLAVFYESKMEHSLSDNEQLISYSQELLARLKGINTWYNNLPQDIKAKYPNISFTPETLTAVKDGEVNQPILRIIKTKVADIHSSGLVELYSKLGPGLHKIELIVQDIEELNEKIKSYSNSPATLRTSSAKTTTTSDVYTPTPTSTTTTTSMTTTTTTTTSIAPTLSPDSDNSSSSSASNFFTSSSLNSHTQMSKSEKSNIQSKSQKQSYSKSISQNLSRKTISSRSEGQKNAIPEPKLPSQSVHLIYQVKKMKLSTSTPEKKPADSSTQMMITEQSKSSQEIKTDDKETVKMDDKISHEPKGPSSSPT